MVEETPRAKYEGVRMVELLLSMRTRVPELERLPVEPSTMKRMLSSPSEPIRRVEETLRLPERIREDPEEEAYELNPPWSVASPTVRRVPEVETALLDLKSTRLNSSHSSI